MSSLRKQLATIHAKSTNELDIKAQKAAYSQSILFEPQVAATQSLDILYQLCYEGFQELCALDVRFVKFERSIFSPQSKAEDRLLMTKKQNEELDVVLEKFLGLVGALLQLKPALKAVEWVIRKFRAHEHNTDTLIYTFLPYHATPMFPALLSILPKQLSPALKFLHPYISQLTRPPRSVIVFTAAHNTNFFAGFNRYVLNVSRAHHAYHVLLSFWASVVAQSINDMLDTSSSGRQNVQRQRTEDLLTRLLPVLNEGLGMRDLAELSLGCYMLITILVSKTSLDDKVLDALMAAVVQNFNAETSEAGLGCIAVIAEQRQAIVLPRMVLKSLLRLERLGERLQMAAAVQPMNKLIIGILHGVVSQISKQLMPQSLSLLSLARTSTILTDAQRQLLTKEFNEHLATANSSDHMSQELRQQLSEVRAMFEVDQEQDVLQLPAPGGASLDDGLNHDGRNGKNIVGLAGEHSVLDLEVASHIASEYEERSCLSHPITSSLQQLISIFARTRKSEKEMPTFLELPFLHPAEGSNGIQPLTFFVCVWCISPSILARCHALELTAGHISSSKFQLLEHELLLPYAIHALGDQSVKVRRAAADLINTIDRQIGQKSQQDSSKESLSSLSQEIYGPPAKNIKWLTAKTAVSFIRNSLMTNLEECVADPAYIHRRLVINLDQSSSAKNQVVEGAPVQLKNSQKSEVIAFLCDHLTYTLVYAVKLSLINIINSISKFTGTTRMTLLSSCIRQLASLDESSIASISSAENVDSSDIDRAVVNTLAADDQEALDYLLVLLKGSTKSTRRSLQNTASERVRTIWNHLKRGRQQSVLGALLTASLSKAQDTASKVFREEALGLLKTVHIPAELLTAALQQSLDQIQQHDLQPATKRRRLAIDRVEPASGQEENSQHGLALLTLVLETLDTANPEADLNLFYTLFKVLQILQDLRVHTTSDFGYLQNVTLGSLTSLMRQLEKSSACSILDSSLVRIDLLVDCVQKTTSVQARNSALLLLSDVTKYTPQTVLHSIMPIFTLMSTTTVRQNDDFSAHIVDQVIQRIIPVLAQSLRDQRKDLVAATAEILLGFAAAFEHIAPHRRLHLYTMLSTSLGIEESLFAIIVTLVDRFPQNQEVQRFAMTLFRQVSSLQSLVTFCHFMDLALDRFRTKPTLSSTLLKEDDRQYIGLSHLLAVIPLLLQDSVFRGKLSHAIENEHELEQLRKNFVQGLQQTINLEQASAGHAKVHDTCLQIMQGLLALFPLSELAKSVAQLLEHEDELIARTTLNTLRHRVKISRQADVVSKTAIIGLLPQLTQILQDVKRPGLKLNALACIDQICECFGKVDVRATTEVAEVIAGKQCLGSSDQALRVLSLHCMGSIVEILGNDFIPLVQKTVQAATTCLSDSLQTSVKDEKLHNAAYAFFMALTDHVPFMFGRASLRNVLELSALSSVAGLSSACVENRVQFMQLVATRLEMPVLINTTSDTWHHAVKQGPEAIREHLSMLATTVENHAKSTISSNSRILFDALLLMLDIQRTCADPRLGKLYTADQIDILQGSLISVLLSVVLKLNDTMFRPFFMQLLDWSSTGLPASDRDGRMHRWIALFDTIAALSERLKSIFTSYFGYVVERAREALTEDINSSTKGSKHKDSLSTAVKLSVIRALTSSFKHDQDDFWQSPSHFNQIHPALIVQLAKSQVYPPTTISTVVIPCITELAAAASSADHHKSLNKSLLQLLRTGSAKTRLAAVRAQMELAKRLGDDWLSNLPEMLPVINELQDDGDEAVERETERWIKLVESILGERLDSMLQ